MADDAKKFTTRTSQIQSKIQEANLARQKQEASSTQATQAGSTTTPTVTDTPKVTQTAKAMPSITRPDINTIAQRYKTPITTTQIPTDLLSQRTVTLKKAEVPDMLDGDTGADRLSSVLNKWLYEVPENLTKQFGEKVVEPAGKTIDFFSNTLIDTARWGISNVQGYLNKLHYSDLIETPDFINKTLPGYSLYTDYLNGKLNDSELGQGLKEKRDNVLKTIFDTTEKRDQRLYNRAYYKEAKNTADDYAKQGKGIRDAINEGRWDVVTTRVGETVGQMLPAFIVALLTKNPELTVSTVYGSVWGDAYQRSLRDINKNQEFSNLTDEQKDNLASSMATVEAGIESLGDALELAPFMKGKFSISNMLGLKNVLLSFVANLEGSAIIEGGEEVVTEILQTLFKQAYGGSDKISAQELGQIFDDTFLIMQVAGLFGGAGGAIETHNRNTAVNALSHEAEKHDSYEEFEATAQRGGVEDKGIIQEAWSKSKGLTTEQAQILKYDVNYVENQEEKATELYDEQGTIENQLENLRKNPEENKEKISKLENKLQDINSQIEEIDRSIQEYMEVYGQQKEELPAQKGIASIEGGENLSEQTMVKVSEEGFDKDAARQAFENSVKQIIQEKKDYTKTEFADYAYYNTTKNVVSTKERMQLVDKVENLLNNIGISTRYVTEQDEDLKGAEGLYERDKKRVTYINYDNNAPIYGHEVFHAMMDVINNYTLTDRELQKKLKSALKKAINDVKGQFGIDIYKPGTKEYKYANIYAEEWLANSFGEYLAGRELAGPRTFVQRIKDFFNDIIDWFLGNERLISRELEKAFDAIADGKVVKAEGGFTVTPIEASTEFTQRELRNVEGYAESQEENALQTKQQNELGEHGEEIMEAGKQSDYENEIYNDSMNVEVSEDVLSGRASITPKVIKDVFGKNKKKRFKALSIMKTEALQGVKDILTPAKTRIFNISLRIGGRLIQMETHRDFYTHRYRERAKPFVEAISKLDDKAKLEIKKVLLDYGALAYEQGENIEQYKQEEVAKLKEVLNKYGISEKATNDMFVMLNELGQRYKDAGLSITLSDIYFPRTVTDYEGLQEYISNVTGIPQEEKSTLLKRIQDITIDNKLTEEEKEKKIRHWMTTDYHEPGKTSKNAKERKMGLLSEWGEGIYQFYGDPIEALDSYIVTMEDAIQKQLFLGGLQEDAGLKGENVSLEEILMGLVREGKISNEKLKELKESVSSVLNKKPTPKVVKTAKSIIHIGLLANFISAITQFDDLGVVILQDRRGLINICKTIFGKAGIKYTDLGLENSYEMFKDQLNITNWFFAKSFFNAIDRLGKTSFINTAWDSLKRQAKKTKDGANTRSREILIKRLTDMYGEETANHIMEKIDSDNYMTNGQVDIDVLTDLLYLLSESQPLYTSDMPTAYLNNGWVKICYSLQSFTIKRMNMLIQGRKQVYKNNGGGTVGAGKATVWLMYTTAFLAIRGAMIGDAQDFLKGDKDETALYKLITEGIDKALEQLWKDSKGSWLKIWNLSDYDKKIYDRQGAWGWLMSKFEPPIIGMGADLLEAITEHNKDEITDLAKYVPIIGKLLYYWFWDELSEDTNKSKWDWGEEKQWNWGDNKEWNWGEEKQWNWD